MTEQQMNSDSTYQQPSCSPCAACNESNTTTTRKRDVNETKTTADDTARRVPQLRFPEFQNAGEWEDCIVENAIKVITPSKKLQSGEFKTIGNFPIIDQSQAYICGYSDDETAILNRDSQELIIFGDHTCILKLVDFPFIQGADGIKIFRSNNQKRLDTKFLYYILQHFHIEPIAYKRHFSELRSKKFLYPSSLKEQQNIADCLLSVDDEINIINQKLEQLKSHKKALLQKLFPQRGKTIPELRFSEFQATGAWQEKSISEVFKRIKERNKKNCQNVLTISALYGLVSQYDYFHKNVAALDVSDYYLLKKNDFAYNKSRSIGYPFGAIKPLKLYAEGVVSTLYLCFRLKNNKYCNAYFEQYFETKLIQDELGKIAQEGARHHGLLNISTDDFFEKVVMLVPTSVNEQKKIAFCLKSIDDVIYATMKKLELLQIQKKALIQQLFAK